MNLIEQSISSIEVAQMVEKKHSELLKDIRRYTEQLNEVNIPLVEFFVESTYVDGKGETRPCYNVTKKGCEFIAHKLTGTKGTIFTARYINRFHEMQEIVEGRKEQLWYIRNFNRKQIILFRDFESLTGIKLAEYISHKKPKCSRLIGGSDWNGYSTNKSREEFKEKYGFEYGDEEILYYLYLRGFIKVLKIVMCESEQRTQKEKIKHLLAEVNERDIRRQENKVLTETKSTPVQINITLNVDKSDICG